MRNFVAPIGLVQLALRGVARFAIPERTPLKFLAVSGKFEALFQRQGQSELRLESMSFSVPHRPKPPQETEGFDSLAQYLGCS